MSPTSYRAAPPRVVVLYLKIWWRLTGSNRRPSACKADALPAELSGNIAWQRSTLPEPFGSSTIDAGGLNGRVRDGNAWVPSAIITKRSKRGLRLEN